MSDELARKYVAAIELEQRDRSTELYALVRDASERVAHFFAGTRLRDGRYYPLFSATPGLAKCFRQHQLAGSWATFLVGLHIVPAPEGAHPRVEFEEPPDP